MKAVIPFLKEHETGVIEAAAIITSSLRWIITFMPVDGLQFRLAQTLPIWEALSALLSVAFAVVEVYATAFMMRAWNRATLKRDRWMLLALWVVSLVVMVVVQFPPLYANIMNVNINTLPQAVVIPWIISVALSTFVIIAGVSYADTVYKRKTETKQSARSPYTVVKKADPQIAAAPAAPQLTAGKPLSYEQFREAMLSLGADAPTSVEEVEQVFGMSHATAGRRMSRYRNEV